METLWIQGTQNTNLAPNPAKGHETEILCIYKGTVGMSKGETNFILIKLNKSL